MFMDLHPILVHYPVAFLSVYAIFELLNTKMLSRRPHWFYIKGTLVIIGTMGAFLALVSGLFSPNYVDGMEIMEMHKKFAFLTTFVFLVISAFYALVWFGGERSQFWTWKILSNRRVMVPLALLGLLLILITGGIGGAMVYGKGFNPVMGIVFKLLGI